MPVGPRKASATACPLQGERGRLGHRSVSLRALEGGGRGRQRPQPSHASVPCGALFWLKWEKAFLLGNKASAANFSEHKPPVSSPPGSRAVGWKPDGERSWPRVTQSSHGSLTPQMPCPSDPPLPTRLRESLTPHSLSQMNLTPAPLLGWTADSPS